MKTNRPKIQVPVESIDLILDLVVLAILLCMWAYVFVSYTSLPEIIPSHFNAHGEVDGHSSKSSIWLLMTISTIIAVGMYVLTKFPHVHNYLVEITEENAAHNYKKSCRLLRFVNLFTILIMLYVLYSVIEKAVGNELFLGSSFIYIVIIFSVIMPIILYIYMSKKNKDTSSTN
jgi:uncharacterized membrane protein